MARVKMTAKERKDNKEFFAALRLMEQEKGISAEYLAEKIKEMGVSIHTTHEELFNVMHHV